MNPLIVTLLPSLIKLLTEYGPVAYSAAVKLLHTENPTLADFEALKITALKTAADYLKADAGMAATTDSRVIVP